AASAATTDSADVSAEILTALSVAVDSTADTLNFGTIADGGIAANASLVVTPAGALVSCPALLICGGTTAAPTFHVDGLALDVVAVSFVNATETLTSTGADTLSVGAFTTNLTGNQLTLDNNGESSFAVGGTLTVAPNQPAGLYTGSVSVSVAYN